MAKLTIQNVFVNETPANADDVNENFDDVASLVNGNLGDDNVDTISETNINFITTSAGHDHSGGSKGKTIAMNEGDITFDTDEGHNHDGADSRLAALAVANTTQGTLIVKSGTLESIADEDSDTVTFGTAFPNAIIAVDVYHYDETGAMSNEGLGIKSYDEGEPAGYYLANVSVTGFHIYNERGETSNFKWTAIGC